MENKLELKQLASYLPYGVKCYCQGLFFDDYAEPKIPITVEIVGLNIDYVEIHEIGRTVTEQYDYSDIFPLLRPLSQLITEIEHNGEKFVPIEKLPIIGFESIDLISDIQTGWVRQEDFKLLLSWHFDCFGLIDRNLAEPIV
jgi:hypothetical protein